MMKSRPSLLIKSALVVCAVVGFVGLNAPLSSWGQGPLHGSTPPPQWRPTNPPDDARYVGQQTCAECHREQAASYRTAAMARALEPIADCQILRAHPRLTFRSGHYSYTIVRQGDQSIYTVTDGVNTISEPILYCFGQGHAGQTYVFRHGGTLYESRISFYEQIKNLDYTLGVPRSVPKSLDDAAGRAMDAKDARNCFVCHSTASVAGPKLQLDKLMPGVSCESCHGSGEKHVAAMKAGNFKEKSIFNPGTLSGDELSQEFCASCHRSVEDVMAMPGRGGINNVRFQPYRIFNSPCYSDDRRISCTACHDPHRPLKLEPTFYDSKCTACHQEPKAAAGSAAPVAASAERAASPSPHPAGTTKCVTCHMPKIELEGSHFQFTDHHIRVVRPGEPYPN